MEKIKENEDVSTSSILIWSDKNREQGFDFVTLGYNRECDMDGFVGMVIPILSSRKIPIKRKDGRKPIDIVILGEKHITVGKNVYFVVS